MRGFLIAACLIMIVAVFAVNLGTGQVTAQGDDQEATIAALETQYAQTRATSTARGKKINAQRTVIADQKTEIANLAGQVPPTVTPTPVLSGKDAYTWLSVPAELDVRPFDHLGEKWVFCGSVQTIFVAGPGEAFYPGESVSTGWNAIVQVRPDGYDGNFLIGFDGETAGIYEGSYVCVWASVVDTASFTNAFGGTISNTLFDAEFLELQ